MNITDHNVIANNKFYKLCLSIKCVKTETKKNGIWLVFGLKNTCKTMYKIIEHYKNTRLGLL